MKIILKIISKIDDLYKNPSDNALHKIQTHYEKIWLDLGKSYKICIFQDKLKAI